MTIGISCYNMGAREFVELAVAADEFGFDALWLGEHLFRSAGYESEHPRAESDAGHQLHKAVVDTETELIDPWVAFGGAASVTSRISFATGIYLLSLRHPLATARIAATAAELAPGRIRMGVGAGWLKEEFDALGVPYAKRMGRFEEAIEVFRNAVSGGEFEHQGAAYSFPRLQVTTRPVEIPLVLGGNGPQAIRRAARLGDGWFASGTPSLEDAVALGRALNTELERNEVSRPFERYFRVSDPQPDTIARYRENGIDNVIVWADQIWHGTTLTERRDRLTAAAAELGLPPEESR